MTVQLNNIKTVVFERLKANWDNDATPIWWPNFPQPDRGSDPDAKKALIEPEIDVYDNYPSGIGASAGDRVEGALRCRIRVPRETGYQTRFNVIDALEVLFEKQYLTGSTGTPARNYTLEFYSLEPRDTYQEDDDEFTTIDIPYNYNEMPYA